MRNQLKYNILLILLIPYFCLSQNQFNEIGEREGSWSAYHENGIIKYEGNFINGKEVGVFHYYDYDGNLAIKLNYLDTGLTSQAILYYPNGSIKSQGTYLNKKKHNVWLYYNSLGKMMIKENYFRGVIDGEVIYYYDNNLISEKYTYINGLKNGEANIFYSSGLLNVTCNYLNNKLHGQAKFYYNNQSKKLESEGKYINGLKDSIWIFYNEIGDVIKMENYYNGSIVK